MAPNETQAQPSTLKSKVCMFSVIATKCGVGFIVWLDAWCCIPGCSHDLLRLLQLACRIGNFITRGPINTEQQLSVEEMVPNAAEIIADIVAEATEQRAMLGDFGNVEGVRHPIARNKLPR